MRKRSLAVGAMLLLTVVLTACGGEETEPGGKDRSYEILDAGGQALYTVSDADAVARIDGLLTAFTSGEGTLAGDEEMDALYTYVCYQEATVLAGGDPAAERDRIEVLRLTVPAEGTEVRLQVLGEGTDALADAVPQLDLGELLTFSYDADEATVEALRDPAQFTVPAT